ncbi:MAG: hypothetical protein LUG24_09475 [Clostridiales bacterium]|nr:hypothetical protein [Clostridiales bacterium]
MTSSDKIIQGMVTSGNYSADEIIEYVKTEYREIHLSPQTLGMLFEVYAGVSYDENDPASCFSREISIEELKSIHPDFESTNGCQWARSDNSYLGKRYIIKRPKAKGRVAAVKLDGANNKSIKRNRGIKREIVDKLSKQRCSILDISTNIEIDHKDGHYDVLSNQDTVTQKESDFQPLSKAANDAKRSHCSRCISTGKRYDAAQLGYSQGFILGDEDTKTCQGCYWHDPKYFNSIIFKEPLIN